jgi:hypothetical protein
MRSLSLQTVTGTSIDAATGTETAVAMDPAATAVLTDIPSTILSLMATLVRRMLRVNSTVACNA